MDASVVGVSLGSRHAFSKAPQQQIRLLAGLGVEGDAHCGATVRHRSRVAVDPTQPNLRQVHLLHEEMLVRLAGMGYAIAPGEIGENITTRGVALLDLPVDTLLQVGPQALLRVTGLRNPCAQLDRHRSGLTAALLDRDADGGLLRLAGVMAVVVEGGEVTPGDPIGICLPALPHRRLERV